MIAKTLGDLIARNKRTKFTNRYNEIQLFTSLLLHDTPEYNVLCIYGVGGIGKSTLLNEFSKVCQDHSISFVHLEGSETQTVVKFARTFRKQLSGKNGGDHSGNLIKALDGI